MKKSHNKNKSRKIHRKSRKNGGGCGCGCPSDISKVHGGSLTSNPIFSTVGGKRKSRRSHKTRKMRKYKGGSNLFNSDLFSPYPFVKQPYNIINLYPPSNYYAVNRDPTLQTNILQNNCNIDTKKGGKRKSRKQSKHRGGGIITDLMPQDLLNLGRTLKHDAYNLYTNFIPKQHGTSPSVMAQPINKNVELVGVPHIDIAKIRNMAKQTTMASLK